MRLYAITFITLITFGLVSCDLDGVKTDKESGTDKETPISPAIDTSETPVGLTQSDSTQGEEPYALLKDTIEGQVNEMVYQREDGLRIEWTVKKSTDAIELNDVVMVNFEARIAGGKVYDSNKELGEPVPLKSNIGMMTKGLEAGLLNMSVGDKGRIMIPTALGYGEQGHGKIVPPGADLIVEIEIVEKIQPQLLEEGVKVYRWKKNEAGKLPLKNDLITFDYFAFTKGEKGHLYDNSFKDSEPFSFRLMNDNVVDGLHQGMGIVHNGEHAFIEIPAKLAYGKKGLVDLVPKNTDIVYDVRVLSIN